MTYKEDLQGVHEKIDKLTNSIGERRNFPLYISIASLVLTAVGLIMLATWIEPHLQNDQKNTISLEVARQLKDPLDKIGEKDRAIEKLQTSLNELRPFIQNVIGHQFDTLARLPIQTLLDRLPAVNNLVATAKDQDVKVSPKLIEQTGSKFIDVSADNNSAWATALAFANYRTFLNIGLSPKPAGTIELSPRANEGYSFEIGLKPKPGTEKDEKVLALSVSIDRVPPPANPQESARAERLSSPQPQGSTFSHIYITGRADDIVLDDVYLKNVTISDADIIYEGGPVRLENVIFINCRFHISNVKRGRELGGTILRAASINYSPTAV